MSNLVYIREELDKLKAEIDSYPLKSEDLRTSYLELTFSVFDLYYRQWCSIGSARIIKEKSIEVTQEEFSILEVFIGSVDNEDAFYSIRNNFNRNLLIDTWSTFEFCLTYICDSLFDDKIKEELLKDDFRKMDKILLKYGLEDSDRAKIEKAFAKGHLTHLPVNRKYDKIYSLFKDEYTGNWVQDKEFLEFYGKYRNCMHTNYIYHGRDKEYTFLGTTFKFSNGKSVTHSKVPDIREMFDLALNLKNICRKLFDAIQYPDLLPYPEGQPTQPS